MTAKATAAIVWKTDVYGITRGGGYTIECVNNGRDRTTYFYRVFHNGHAIPDLTPDRRLWPLSAAKRKAEQHAKSTVSPATPTEGAHMTSPDTLEAAARTAADKAHAARKAADRAAGYADLARGTEHFARAEAIARQADDDAVAAEREAKRTADRADAARIEVDRAALHNSAHYQAEMARMLD